MNQVQWILVSDRLPPLDHGVLVFAKGFGVTCASRWTWVSSCPESNWRWDGHLFSGYTGEWEFDFQDSDVTHWAELPQPPSAN